jgi:hypothetical protein
MLRYPTSPPNPGRTLRRLTTSAAFAFAAIHAAPAVGAAGTAVEYYNAALKHYFMTAFPEEAAMLDQGNLVQGWKRTGGEFTVYTDPAPDRRPVCRFYGAIGLGPVAPARPTRLMQW